MSNLPIRIGKSPGTPTMSQTDITLNVTNNAGYAAGVHNGDFHLNYHSTVGLTLEHIALTTHEESKQKWESSKTCAWLLQRGEYQSWNHMEEKSLLWLHGPPGYGKTTLMSRVIEEIRQGQIKSNARLLYSYVGFKDNQEDYETLYRNMLLTFWEQANKTSGVLPTGEFGNSPHSERIAKQLGDLLASSQHRVYIVIDAVDQLPVIIRNKLIRWLNDLVQRPEDLRNRRRLHVAISSRNDEGLSQLYHYDIHRIEVTPDINRSDIKEYLDKTLISELFDKKPQLRQNVSKKLRENADGMFLWASLQCSNICNMEMESQVENALSSLILPQDMQKFFQSQAKEVKRLTEPIAQNSAQRTLALLARCGGKMSKAVIIEAAAFNDNADIGNKTRQELTQNPNRIAVYCRNLVHFSENLGIFEFCHKTVYEFFKSYESTTHIHRIAELCLSYISSPLFSQGPSDNATWYNPGNLGPLLQQHPFMMFAACNWATFLKKCPKESEQADPKVSRSSVLKRLGELFKEDEKGGAEPAKNLRLAFQLHLLNLRIRVPRKVYAEHIASYYGLVEHFNDSNPGQSFDLAKLDDNKLTPMHWAIQNERDLDDVFRTVKEMVKKSKVDAQDYNGCSPLYYAAYHGNRRVTELLVKAGSNIDLRNQNDETALIAACRKHHHDIVLFLAKKSNVTIQSASGTALQAICLAGCLQCAEEILQGYKDSKIVEHSGPFGTSLHAASYYGHIELVKLLCSKKIKVGAIHKTYGNAITAAAAGCTSATITRPFEQIIEELVQRGVKVNDKSGTSGPPLLAAANNGNTEIVRLLLSKGAKVRKAIGVSGTAYEAAEYRGHHEIMAILKQSDAKAPDYSSTKRFNSQDHHQMVQRTFKATVKLTNMGAVEKLVGQFEVLFAKEAEKGDTRFLRALANLGKNCFIDVVELATQSHGSPNKPSQIQNNDGRLRHRDKLYDLFCIKFAKQWDQQTSGSSYPVSSPLRRQSSTFAQDPLTEHFPQVLDLMTQAAVKILERTIASDNDSTIQLVANTWIDALYELISYSGFGEPMLERVVQKRASELREHLNDPNPDGSYNAANLGLVGINLLFLAITRGPKLRRLSFTFAKLWIQALNDLADLGDKGEAQIQKFKLILLQRFGERIEFRDEINAINWAQAAIELLNASALNPKSMLVNLLHEAFLQQWQMALERMKDLTTKLSSQNWKEYCTCLENNEYDNALGLSLVAIQLLRTAIEWRSRPIADMLRSLVTRGFQKVRAGHDDQAMSTRLGIFQHKKIRVGNLEVIIESFISSFMIAEEVWPKYLNGLAKEILRAAGAALEGDDYQELIRVINRYAQKAGHIIDKSEREGFLTRISRTILMFIDIALNYEEPNHSTLTALEMVALGELAEPVRKLMDKGEFARYSKATRYLSQSAARSGN